MKVQYISELLYRHECVIVPGFGGFITSYVPARVDSLTHRFYPPSCEVAFNESLSTNDGILANHISKVEGITYREAIDEIRFWVEDVVVLLRSGEKFEMAALGVFVMGPVGNIQFEPESGLNYLGNSFGLPSFVAQSVTRKRDKVEESPRRVQPRPGRIIAETLKWAAVIVPFVAFTLWGTMNTDKLGNYVQNYSGFYSWVKSTPGKTSTHNIKQVVINQTVVDEPVVVSPGGLLNAAGIELSPASISYDAMRLLTVSETKAAVAVSPVNNAYYIIGGAFKEHSNALKMVSELNQKGHPAMIVDTTARGMYVVGIQGFVSRLEALHALPGIQEAGYTGAWIMRKK
ncbi:MAG: SPOR domain-containing protein [Bacteroidales bacterium]|nr:SPOR domain-containing protein [Bacteroidales bacterium]